jgi:tripartite-type tricarboxylate transporter receptor subunit TctC
VTARSVVREREKCFKATGAASLLAVFCFTAAWIGVSTSLRAQTSSQDEVATYPNRLLRFIVGSDAGSAPDVLARIVANGLTAAFGQQVIVENRPGAAGIIGADHVARSPPDGYTVMFSAAIHTVTPAVRRNLPYHPIDSFTPVARVVSTPFVLVVTPRLPVNTVQELVAYAKNRPSELNYSSPGVGSAQHLSAALLGLKSGITFTHVPYKSGSGAVNAILTGDVHFCFVGLPVAITHVKGGTLRALAVTTAARFPTNPEVPTVGEAGLAGFEADNWHAVFGPARIPSPIVDRLHAGLAKTMAMPEVKARIVQAGGVVNMTTPDELLELMRAELDKWSSTAKAAGVRPE